MIVFLVTATDLQLKQPFNHLSRLRAEKNIKEDFSSAPLL